MPADAVRLQTTCFGDTLGRRDYCSANVPNMILPNERDYIGGVAECTVDLHGHALNTAAGSTSCVSLVNGFSLLGP